MNALLIICRTVGCAKGTGRIIRNNAEEVIEKTSIWVEGKKSLYSLFLYTISNTVYICIIYYKHPHTHTYIYIYIYIYAVYEEVFIGMVFCVPYLFCYFLLKYNNTMEENFGSWYGSPRTVMPEEEEEEEEGRGGEEG